MKCLKNQIEKLENMAKAVGPVDDVDPMVH